MKIDKIHVYIGFGLSQKDVTPMLESKLQEILIGTHFSDTLSSWPMGIFSHTVLRLGEATNLIQRYQQLLSALEKVYTEVDEDLPDLWQVPMVASTQPLAIEKEPAGDQLLGWVLGEFGTSLILDAFVYSHQRNKEPFKQFREKPIFYIWKPEVGVFRVKRRPEKQLRKMHNIDPNDPPQEITLENVSIKDLPHLAEVAYADVEVTEQIGGKALLLSFSLERNSPMIKTKEGNFTFYNAVALGLKHHVQPNSLIDHIQQGTIRIRMAVAEPSSQEWEE